MDTIPDQALTRPDNTLILVAGSTVLFPGVVMPIAADQAAAAIALQQAARDGGHVAVVLQRDPAVEAPTLADLYPIGTEARLLRYVTARDGSHHAIVQGVGRVRLITRVEELAYPAVTVERIAEPSAEGTEIAALVHQLRERALETLSLIEQTPPELVATVQNLEPPGMLADLVTSLLDLSSSEKQAILETVDLHARLGKRAVAPRISPGGSAAVIGDRQPHATNDGGATAGVHAARAAQADPEGVGRG